MSPGDLDNLYICDETQPRTIEKFDQCCIICLQSHAQLLV